MVNKYAILLCIMCVQMYVTASHHEIVEEPYRSIKDLPFDNHGWFSNARQLDQFLVTKPKTIIEVGSWLGCSTRYLAANQAEDGVLYAVDHWQPLNSGHYKDDPRLPYVYQLFLSNIKHAGLTHKVIPIRMRSLEAAKALNVQADLIYIDAAHDTVSVLEDITHWYPHLNDGGVLCGDDWIWETVRVAVIQKAAELGKIVHADGNFWWYE